MSVFQKKGSSWSVCYAFALVLILVPFGIRAAAAAEDASDWKAPDDARAVKNPVKPSPAGLKEAKDLFEQNCVPCHGATGAGDGPASQALSPKPANFTDKAMMGKATDGELFWKMTTGKAPMPSWSQFSDTQRWELVNYVRTFSKKAS